MSSEDPRLLPMVPDLVMMNSRQLQTSARPSVEVVVVAEVTEAVETVSAAAVVVVVETVEAVVVTEVVVEAEAAVAVAEVVRMVNALRPPLSKAKARSAEPSAEKVAAATALVMKNTDSSEKPVKKLIHSTASLELVQEERT